MISHHLTECPRVRETHGEGPYLRFWRDLGGLTHPWVGLTTHKSLGLGSPLWAGLTRPRVNFTSKMKIKSYCSDWPRQNFFLYISKGINGKFWISSLNSHFLKGSLTKKIFWDFSFLVSDPFKKWTDNPEMKNFLYISKKINGKFSILRLSDHFLEGS